MLFRDWLDRHDETRAEIASRLGVHRVTIQRWIAGSDLPRPEVIAKVYALTGGAVGHRDFLEAYFKHRVASNVPPLVVKT